MQIYKTVQQNLSRVLSTKLKCHMAWISLKPVNEPFCDYVCTQTTSSVTCFFFNLQVKWPICIYGTSCVISGAIYSLFWQRNNMIRRACFRKMHGTGSWLIHSTDFRSNDTSKISKFPLYVSFYWILSHVLPPFRNIRCFSFVKRVYLDIC
jgi:hypothetical protein